MRCRKSDSLPASVSSSPASSHVPLQWKHLSTESPLNLIVVSSKPSLGQRIQCAFFSSSISTSFILRARSIARLCRRVVSSLAKNSSSSCEGFLVALMVSPRVAYGGGSSLVGGRGSDTGFSSSAFFGSSFFGSSGVAATGGGAGFGSLGASLPTTFGSRSRMLFFAIVALGPFGCDVKYCLYQFSAS